MSSNSHAELKPFTGGTQTGYPTGSTTFDWTMVALSVLFIAGLWVDGWAHFHGKTDGTFFTPWHLIFYSAFAICAAFLGFHQFRNISKGHIFSRALPEGYGLSLIGVGVFALGGVGDMVWHTLFGIEGGSEALTSPTHILLGIGMGLVVTGSVRAAWARWKDRNAISGWRSLGAMLIGVTLFLTLFLFFISYSSPIVYPFALRELSRGGNSMQQDFAVSGILLNAAIMTGAVALLAWRWRLPFGTFTLMFGVSTAMLTLLNDFFVLIIPAMIAGLIVDTLYQVIKPSPQRRVSFLGFTFAAPFVFFSLYMAAILIVGTRWSIHVWAGSAFLAGVTGFMIGLLITQSGNHDKAV